MGAELSTNTGGYLSVAVNTMPAHHAGHHHSPEVPHAVMAHAPKAKDKHDHHHSSLLTKVLLGAGVVTLGIVMAPYLLHLMDSADLLTNQASDSLKHASSQIDGLCGDGPPVVKEKYLDIIGDGMIGSEKYPFPTPGENTLLYGELVEQAAVPKGWAGDIAQLVSDIPWIGETLAKGGTATAIASTAIGIGGALVGHYVSKREDGSTKIRWGNVIKTAALVTSIFISMPAILTGLSMGITVIGHLSGFSEKAIAPVVAKLGTIGMKTSALNNLSVILPHFFTCGIPVLGPLLGGWMAKRSGNSYDHSHHHTHDVPPGEATHRIKLLSIEPPLQKGVESTVEFCLTDLKTNRILQEKEMEVMHGMPIHAFVTEPTLSEYHHVHPQAVEGKTGVFSYKFTPQHDQGLKMFADIHPKGSHYQALQEPLPQRKIGHTQKLLQEIPVLKSL
jgi:hypothetical protein